MADSHTIDVAMAIAENIYASNSLWIACSSGRPLSGRRQQRVCSPRAASPAGGRRATASARPKSPGSTENAALRQRVAEFERLVGQLRQRLWPVAYRW